MAGQLFASAIMRSRRGVIECFASIDDKNNAWNEEVRRIEQVPKGCNGKCRVADQ